ncbi:MAG: DUF4097 family beta strand repeat-containing protein [Candidatus Aminicenantes bacterium]|nr:DUF4097 family beta strand repeat-containing protein [Candidatus Aminicenantes bacterium]
MNEITMKKTAVGAVLLGLVLLAGNLAARDRVEEKFARTEALDRNGKVSVQNVSGTIQVRSWAKAEVQIDAVKVSEASSEERAKENAGKVTIEVVKEGGALRIETKYPEGKLFGGNVNVHVNYVVTIPDQAALRVKNVSGDIEVQGIGGDVDIDEVSGGVKIVSAARSVECRTVSGGIILQGAGGEVNLKAVSGGIKAEDVTGSIEAETVSGGVTLRNVREASSVRAKTISGGIECETDILPNGRYNFDALSGGITLTLPATASFEIEAETFSGHIQTDFAVVVSGKLSPKELRGTVGTGGATLRVKSFSGKVEILKK